MATSARLRRDRCLLQPCAVLVLAFLLRVGHAQAAPAASTPSCLTGSASVVAGDVAAITSVRSSIEAACPCAAYGGSPGKTTKEYGACADAVIAAAARAGQLRKQCQTTVEAYYDQSICGLSPNLHSAVCLKTDTATRQVSCS